MLKALNIALFGVTQAGFLDLTMQLQLALDTKTLALTETPDGVEAVVCCNVYQPLIPADGQLMERDFQLCFLPAQQTHPQVSDLTHADDHIRQTLHDSGLPYQVLYGSYKDQLATIVNTVTCLIKKGRFANLSTHPVCEDSRSVEHPVGRSWVHSCERCGDPPSERSLLSSLLALRARSSSASERR